MAGETWRGYAQAGKEVGGYGVEAAATRKMYYRDPKFTRVRDPRVYRFATGTRDNVRNVSLGPVQVAGTLVQPLSAEAIELFLIGIKGGVTAVGAGADKTWTFKPDPTLDSATYEWHDGARAWHALGCYANSLHIVGNVTGENLITAEVFGKSLELGAMAGALPDRVPDVFEGWEAKLYTEDFGAAPGATNVPASLISWDVMIGNGLGRKYFADNTKNLGAVTVGELQVEATLVYEAAAAIAATEFANWDAVTKRTPRLEFGNNKAIAGGALKENLTLDIPAAWSALALGGEDAGTRTYELKAQAVYDPTSLAAMFQAIFTTARTAAWAA